MSFYQPSPNERVKIYDCRLAMGQVQQSEVFAAHCDLIECQIEFKNFKDAQETIKKLKQFNAQSNSLFKSTHLDSLDINESFPFMVREYYTQFYPNCKMFTEKLENDFEKKYHQEKVDEHYLALKKMFSFSQQFEEEIEKYKNTHEKFMAFSKTFTFKYQIWKNIGDRKKSIQWGNLCFDVKTDMFRDMKKMIELSIVSDRVNALTYAIDGVIALTIDLSIHNPLDRIKYFEAFYSLCPKLDDDSLQIYIDMIVTKAIRKNSIEIEGLLPFVEFLIQRFSKNKKIFEQEPLSNKNVMEKQMKRLIFCKNSMMNIDYFHSKLAKKIFIYEQTEFSFSLKYDE